MAIIINQAKVTKNKFFILILLGVIFFNFLIINVINPVFLYKNTRCIDLANITLFK